MHPAHPEPQPEATPEGQPEATPELQPEQRPRPRPGQHAAGVRAPGLGALLRRHPELPRHAAAGAIVAGIAVFVIASLTATGAVADPKVGAGGPQTGSQTQIPSLPVAAPVQKVLSSNPTHVKTPAPVNHGVISALAANGIPSVALNAYRVAAARVDSVDPGCHIDWALLAGIGREESDHGRYGGAILHADGTSTPRIIGPALDGIHWDYIPAPANGVALDGDATYAHALGPMQFIPSTWAIFGTDATGDGKADVFNINDAALGAARYLCAAGGDLSTHTGQVNAVLAYNHSDQYLAQVLALADAYRRGVSIAGLPIGITSGALPAIKHHGAIPPANPGPPTAVAKDPKATGSSTPSAATSPGNSQTGAGAGGTQPTPTNSATSTSTPGSGGGGGGGQTSSDTSTAAPPPPDSSTPPQSTTEPPPPPPSSPTATKTCNPLEVLLGCKPS